MSSLLVNFDLLMNVAGFQDLSQINKSTLGLALMKVPALTVLIDFSESFQASYKLPSDRS